MVAPISMMLPFSTKGKKASCWALLKRCISSTNTMVRSPSARLRSAFSITWRISLIPLVTAENSMKLDLVVRAMTWARVVLPTPGGPQKIIDDTPSDSIMRRRTLPGPIRWRWPTMSSSVSGLSRAARGWGTAFSKRESCPSMMGYLRVKK